MYFPYLRGKQYELIALREMIANKSLTDKVIPIIEPIKASSTLKSVLNQFKQSRHQIAVIQNPQVAVYTPFSDPDVQHLKKQNFFIPAILINDENDLLELDKYGNQWKMVIVTKQSQLSLPENNTEWDKAFKVISLEHRLFRRVRDNKKIELDDSFLKQQRNADYAANPDQFFSENHLYFAADNCFGFSDYSVIGEEYVDKGFAPMAVAIHVVYFDVKNNLRVHHFVSDNNNDISDPARKFNEALKHLMDWYKGPEFNSEKNDSVALHEFERMFVNELYSGLGIVKKLSIQHHLEIMGRYLSGW